MVTQLFLDFPEVVTFTCLFGLYHQLLNLKKLKRKLCVVITLFLLAILSTVQYRAYAQKPHKIDHNDWDVLLKKYVKNNGLVDYQAFISEKKALEQYLNTLRKNPPNDQWTTEEKLAYWINAYNAFTVKLIVDNYPLKSIKDLNPTLSIPKISTVWTKEWFKIGQEDFSLDKIEHQILRKKFEEPRIHFAVNCASFSCPVLRPEAYTASKIDQQLTDQAKLFLNDPQRNVITENKVKLSKIFSWFGGDFKKGQSLINFINQYSNTKVREGAKVGYLKYDWRLNDHL